MLNQNIAFFALLAFNLVFFCNINKFLLKFNLFLFEIVNIYLKFLIMNIGFLFFRIPLKIPLRDTFIHLPFIGVNGKQATTISLIINSI